MVPTLFGRIQTRIAVLAVIGSIWILIIGPALPQKVSLSDRYQASFLVLGLVMGIGILWEFLYHGLQQFRWEKDWPILWGLLLGLPEGAVVWAVLREVIPSTLARPDGTSFLIAFGTVWVVVWLWVNGPMRVPLIHWRFRGGRIV